LNNFTAGVREREDVNRTRVAGHLDEIQGVVANTLDLFRNGAVGFIDWLDGWWPNHYSASIIDQKVCSAKQAIRTRRNTIKLAAHQLWRPSALV
jgi:hypothetical protein